MTGNIKSIILLLLTMMTILFCSCGTKDEDKPNIPTTEELIASQYDQLTTALADATETEDIVSYISVWASEKSISSYVTENGTLIMKKDASKGCEDQPSRVLMCSIDEGSIENEMQYLASLLYTFDNIKKHGTAYCVIVPDGKTSELPDEVISCDEFINYEYAEKPYIVSSCAASSEYELSSSCTYAETGFDVAYKISITGLDGGRIDEIDESHPNAMLSVSKLLAGFKSSGLLYDLAYLKGGSGYDSYSESAEAVIVISKNDQEKFEKKVTKAIEKFDSKWKDKQKDAEYTYKKVKKPSEVLAPDDRDNLISLLYTMITGTYQTHEESGDIIAYANIGKVSVKDGQMKVKIKAFSHSEPTLEEMNDSIRTLSKMSDFSPHKTSSSELWNERIDSDLYKGLEASAAECSISLPKNRSTFRTHECGIIKDKNKKAHLLSLGTGFENWADVADTVITYLSSK